MAEQFLDFSKVRTHVEEMGRVAVPEPMRVHPIDDADLPRPRLEDPANVARPEATRAAISRAK